MLQNGALTSLYEGEVTYGSALDGPLDTPNDDAGKVFHTSPYVGIGASLTGR